ncbi:asparagine synthase-related protein [Deinococcus sp. JMULE3]|uniref:asparagine synthase-related protein n=1 Tax=Deinococcus sp. JMULE3 TaxID=2518341 RepID=UPI001576306A|nr:asparagine synthase-related protein [Deinococcus sp. JMULE3]NTY01078.1 hypothetical protein [Deinococcus sp. JMULE3]
MFHISNNSGFQWHTLGNDYFKGYFYHKDDFYEGLDAILFLRDTLNINDARQVILTQLNGMFAFKIDTDNYSIVCTDKIRTFPIFYCKVDGKYVFRDELLASDISITIDDLARSEFLASSYTFNDRTLLTDWRQLMPGQTAVLDKNDNQLSIDYYWRHTHHRNNHDTVKIKHELSNISIRVFQRLIQSSKGKQLAIPLSGGYDSRYIVTMLKMLGAKNVICYTYGRSDSFEVKIAQQVAQKIGYDCAFVEYTPEKWRMAAESASFHKYISEHHYFSAVPHIQDFIALKHLKDNDLIEKDAIIVPGFCGDLIGGSYLPASYINSDGEEASYPDITDYIIQKHLINITSPDKEFQRELIKNDVRLFLSHLMPVGSNSEEFIEANEIWFTEHKVSKFVVNAVRLFEYFEYEYRLPLWDDELVNYWYSINNTLRIDNKLYNAFLFEYLFNKQEVGFLKPTPKSRGKLGKKISKIVPPLLLNTMLKIYYKIDNTINPKDINNFGYLEQYLSKESSINHGSYATVNGYLAHYILHNLIGGKK